LSKEPIAQRGYPLEGTAGTSYGDARGPQTWFAEVAMPFGLVFIVTLAASAAVYGIVRAIGWVIGGFAAS